MISDLEGLPLEMGRERVRRIKSAARPGRANMETRFGSIQQVNNDSWDVILLNFLMIHDLSSVEYGKNFDSYGSVIALVMSDGTVIYVPPARFPATCQMDLRRWPFDQQTCLLKIGSWTYNAHQINLLLGENSTGLLEKESAISVEYMTPHDAKTSPWKLISTSVSHQQKIYKCCPEPYPSADVLVTLQRSSSLYHYTLILPSFSKSITYRPSTKHLAHFHMN